MPLQWFVATTHQGRERVAKQNLDNQRLETYLPMYIATTRRREAVIRPFLPGYLFIHVDTDDRSQWRPVASTFGVKGILVSGEKPQIVHDWIIDGIKDREVDGFIRLEPRALCKFKRGDAVRLKGSPFEAMFMEMEGRDRALILVSLFNKQIPKSVFLSRLVSAAAI